MTADALHFEKRGAWRIECKAGYTIAKFSTRDGGVYQAFKAGDRLAFERYVTPAEQATALQRCKDACAKHYEATP